MIEKFCIDGHFERALLISKFDHLKAHEVSSYPQDFTNKEIDFYTNHTLFDSVRQNALDRIWQEYSPDQFRKPLENILNSDMEKYKKSLQAYVQKAVYNEGTLE